MSDLNVALIIEAIDKATARFPRLRVLSRMVGLFILMVVVCGLSYLKERGYPCTSPCTKMPVPRRRCGLSGSVLRPVKALAARYNTSEATVRKGRGQETRDGA